MLLVQPAVDCERSTEVVGVLSRVVRTMYKDKVAGTAKAPTAAATKLWRAHCTMSHL